jgi:hypothetical protein
MKKLSFFGILSLILIAFACNSTEKIKHQYAYSLTDYVSNEHFGIAECNFYIDSFTSVKHPYKIISDNRCMQKIKSYYWRNRRPVSEDFLYKKMREGYYSDLDRSIDSTILHTFKDSLGITHERVFEGGDFTRYWNFRDRFVFYYTSGKNDTLYIGERRYYPNFEKSERNYYVISLNGKLYLMKKYPADLMDCE